MGNSGREHERPAAPLSVRAEDRPGAVVVCVAGEVDLLTAPQLRAAVDDAVARLAGRVLLLDLSGVTFLGSTGLQILAVAATRVRDPAGGAGLRVVAAHAALRPIRLTGLDAVLQVYSTTDEALRG